MSTGKDAKTMPGTADFRDGYDRIFGDKKPQRGRWIWDERQQRMVSAEEYVPPEDAKNAPIMCDRFMEGQASQDGVDIGSRAKRRRYMEERGVSDASDYGPGWADRVKAAREREESRKGFDATVEAVKKHFNR